MRIRFCFVKGTPSPTFYYTLSKRKKNQKRCAARPGKPPFPEGFLSFLGDWGEGCDSSLSINVNDYWEIKYYQKGEGFPRGLP